MVAARALGTTQPASAGKSVVATNPSSRPAAARAPWKRLHQGNQPLMPKTVAAVAGEHHASRGDGCADKGEKEREESRPNQRPPRWYAWPPTTASRLGPERARARTLFGPRASGLGPRASGLIVTRDGFDHPGRAAIKHRTRPSPPPRRSGSVPAAAPPTLPATVSVIAVSPEQSTRHHTRPCPISECAGGVNGRRRQWPLNACPADPGTTLQDPAHGQIVSGAPTPGRSSRTQSRSPPSPPPRRDARRPDGRSPRWSGAGGRAACRLAAGSRRT